MVHQYQLNGYNIVLDTCSGSIHVVDDVAYGAIALYKERPAEEIVSRLPEFSMRKSRARRPTSKDIRARSPWYLPWLAKQ